jgi:hypothetical protein
LEKSQRRTRKVLWIVKNFKDENDGPHSSGLGISILYKKTRNCRVEFKENHGGIINQFVSS